MASVKPLTVQFSVDGSGAVQGLKIVTQAVDGAAQSMRLSLGDVLGQGAREGGKHIEGLGAKIREFAAEERGQGRLAKFMAGQVAELGIASKGAAGEVTAFISAFAFGGGLGVAAEAVKLVFKAFSESGSEVKKATDDAIKSINTLHTKVEDYLASLRQETEIEKLRRTILAPLEEKEAAQKSELVALTDQLAVRTSALRKSQASGMDLLAEKGRVEALKHQIEEKEKLLGLTEIEANAARKAIKDAGDAKAGVDLKANLEKAALDLAQWRSAEMQEWKKHYDAITEALAKSLQEQDDLENKNALDMAKFRAEQLAEDRKHYKEKEAETLAILQGELTEEQKKNKEKEKSATEAAKTIGNAFGASFAGIITGSESVGHAFAQMGKAALHAVLDAVTKSIQAYALEAAAGAAASQSAIPVVGPVLAVAAIGAMEALVSGLLDSIPSSAGGLGMVPRDQLNFVHKGETILPAPLAETYRKAAEGLGGGGGGGGNHYHFHGTIIDDASVRRLVESGPWQRANREARRNGLGP